MRIFVGVALCEEMKSSLAQAALEAQRLFPGRYALRDNYHCTLKFIGQVDAQGVSRIEKSLKEAAAESKPFSMALAGLSFFRRPQDAVLFCSLEKSQPLELLARNVRNRLLSEGFILEDAPFHSHITLARQARVNPAALSMIHVAPASQQVQEITLFESCRVEEQLRYVPLLRCPLKK